MEQEEKILSAKRPLHLLQVLRGVAAMMVVASHASTVIRERFGGSQPLWYGGAAGVDIFFAISGFVMALSSRSLIQSPSPGMEFMKRRVERIVPLYWLFTTLKIAVLLAAPAVALRGIGRAWHVAASYLFIPSYNPNHEILPVLPVGWTLNCEMLFYVLFATTLACRIRPLKLVTPVLAALVILWVAAPHDSYAILSWGSPVVLEFVFGIALFDVWNRGYRLPQLLSWICIVPSLAVFQFAWWGGFSPLRPIVWGGPALILLMAALSLEDSMGSKVPRWLLEIGDASYSIYLTHTFVVPTLAAVLLRQPFPGLRGLLPVVALSLVLSAFLGVAVYRWVEVPIMAYFRKRRVAVQVA